MSRRCRRWLGLVTLTIAMAAAPTATLAGATSDALLDLAADRGPSLGLAVGVSPLHWALIAPPLSVSGARAAESVLPAELEPGGRAVSLDIKLRWPGAEATTPLEPYVVLGPALLIDRPHEGPSLTGIQGDPVLRLGVKAGAGFNWRLGKDTTLFGAYDITTTSVGDVPGAKAPAAGGMSGYDILYGVRLRY
jgi:hypothetical protein